MDRQRFLLFAQAFNLQQQHQPYIYVDDTTFQVDRVHARSNSAFACQISDDELSFSHSTGRVQWQVPSPLYSRSPFVEEPPSAHPQPFLELIFQLPVRLHIQRNTTIPCRIRTHRKIYQTTLRPWDRGHHRICQCTSVTPARRAQHFHHASVVTDRILRP